MIMLKRLHSRRLAKTWIYLKQQFTQPWSLVPVKSAEAHWSHVANVSSLLT